MKIINDGLGIHEFPSYVGSLLEPAEMQRLKFVQQLGAVSGVFPNATHMRYSHSIGTAAIAATLLNNAAKKGPEKIDEHEFELNVIAGGLYHDLGQFPRSHTCERPLRIKIGYTHEKMSARLIRGEVTLLEAYEKMPKGVVADQERSTMIALLKNMPTPAEALRRAGGNPEIVAEIADSKSGQHHIGKNRFLHEIVSGMIGSDRMDYLLRDSMMAGVKETMFNSEYLMKRVCLVEINGEYHLAVEKQAVQTVGEMLAARRKMHTRVYTHEDVLQNEAGLVEGVKRTLNSLEDKVGECILLMTDAQLQRFVHMYSRDPYASDMVARSSYNQRNGYTIAWGITLGANHIEENARFIEAISRLPGEFPEDTARDEILARVNAGMREPLKSHELIVYVRDGFKQKTKEQQLQSFDLIIYDKKRDEVYFARDRLEDPDLFDSDIVEAFEAMRKPSNSFNILVLAPAAHIHRIPAAFGEYRRELIK